MATYSVDVRIYGTLYITADSQEEANKLAASTKMEGIEIGRGTRDDEQEIVPGVMLAPCMTCHGPDDGESVELWESDDDESDDDESDDDESEAA